MTTAEMTTEYPAHPLAELFPLGPDVDLRSLADSIKVYGLNQPIILWENQVLDGRRRQRACQMAKVEPIYEEWDGECGSPTAFVIVKNLQRRHLSIAERATVAVKAMKLLEEEAKQRQEASRAKKGEKIGAKPAESEKLEKPRGTEGDGKFSTTLRAKSRDQAAELVGISGRTVSDAKKVVDKGAPELQEAMRKGTIGVNRAASIAGRTLEEQIEAVREAESAPRRTGFDEDKLLKQEPRSLVKWLTQHIKLGRDEEHAHRRLGEKFKEVYASVMKKHDD